MLEGDVIETGSKYYSSAWDEVGDEGKSAQRHSGDGESV